MAGRSRSYGQMTAWDVDYIWIVHFSWGHMLVAASHLLYTVRSHSVEEEKGQGERKPAQGNAVLDMSVPTSSALFSHRADHRKEYTPNESFFTPSLDQVFGELGFY